MSVTRSFMNFKLYLKIKLEEEQHYDVPSPAKLMLPPNVSKTAII